jgi:hypothetical protein
MYNMLFGKNPASRLLLAMLDLTEADVGRFRDCYLERAEQTGVLSIVIYTRNGGGNREAYEAVTEALQGHAQYLWDADDDFDCTYASYVFSVPEKFKATAEELATLGAAPGEKPMEKFKSLIEKMQNGADESDPAVKRAMEVGRDIFGKIDEAMKQSAGGSGKIEV